MVNANLEIEKLGFEDAYKELENIVEKLENEQVSLEESLQLFELGQALSIHCSKLLETAEQRLRSLKPDFNTSIKEDEN